MLDEGGNVVRAEFIVNQNWLEIATFMKVRLGALTPAPFSTCDVVC